MRLDVDRLIKSCRFSENQILDATNGLCGTFALALYDTLVMQGKVCDLVLFSEDIDLRGWKVLNRTLDSGFNSWSHVAVAVGVSFFDIRGRVEEFAIHEEYHTDIVVFAQRDCVVKQLQDNVGHYSKRHYNQYIRRLSRALEEQNYVSATRLSELVGDECFPMQMA